MGKPLDLDRMRQLLAEAPERDRFVLSRSCLEQALAELVAARSAHAHVGEMFGVKGRTL